MDTTPRPPIALRPYRPDDLQALLQLFRETIHTVNRTDYTQAQVDAWAGAAPNRPPDAADLARWEKKLATEEVIVAEINGEIVGFCSWDATGYLDFLFVHQAHQRKGIATALYKAAEQALKAKALARVHTQASTTAHPFFSQQGFRTVKHQTVIMGGVVLPNVVMEKPLE